MRLAGVTVSGFGEGDEPEAGQLDLFAARAEDRAGTAPGGPEARRQALHAALDKLADKYGERTVAPADLADQGEAGALAGPQAARPGVRGGEATPPSGPRPACRVLFVGIRSSEGLSSPQPGSTLAMVTFHGRTAVAPEDHRRRPGDLDAGLVVGALLLIPWFRARARANEALSQRDRGADWASAAQPDDGHTIADG